MFIKKVGWGKETERALKLLVLFDFPSYEIFYHWFSGSGSAEGPATNFHVMTCQNTLKLSVLPSPCPPTTAKIPSTQILRDRES